MTPDLIAELVLVDVSRRQREAMLARWARVVACAGEHDFARDLLVAACVEDQPLAATIAPPRWRQAA